MSVPFASLLTVLMFLASSFAPVDKTFLGAFQRLSYVCLALILSLVLWIITAVSQ